ALVVERGAAIGHPAVDAVVTAQAVLHLEGSPRGEVLLEDAQAAREVVRVHAAGPSVAELELERAAGEAQPRLVEVVAPPVQPGAPDHRRRCLDEDAVLLEREIHPASD